MSLMPLASAQCARSEPESFVLRRKPESRGYLNLVMAGLIVVGICGVAHADVYRWVDEHGEAHYTDRWVPGSELIKSSKPRPAEPTPPPSQAQSKASTPSANPAASAKQQQAAEAAVKADVAKTKEAQCKQAKERYQKAIESRRIYKPDKEGQERQYMSDEETDAYRVQARNDVTLTCGSPPAPVEQ